MVPTLRSSTISRVPATETDELESETRSGSPLTPILASVKRTASTSTNPEVLLIVSPVVASTAPEWVMAAETLLISTSPLLIVSPVPASTVNVRAEASPTLRSLTTPSVPLTVASLLTSRSTLTATDVLDSVITSALVLTPILASVKRTSSTSTYPLVLSIVSPVVASVAPEWVMAATVASSSMSPLVTTSPLVPATVKLSSEDPIASDPSSASILRLGDPEGPTLTSLWAANCPCTSTDPEMSVLPEDASMVTSLFNPTETSPSTSRFCVAWMSPVTYSAFVVPPARLHQQRVCRSSRCLQLTRPPRTPRRFRSPATHHSRQL